MAAVAVKYPAFRELGTEVLVISVDSVDSHRAWQEKQLTKMVKGGVIFPMLSDPEGEIGACFGLYDAEKGVDGRGCFLIDPKGAIQSIDILSDPVGRNVSEILRRLRALQHHQATGEYMPCGWQPGRPVLTADTEEAKKACEKKDVWKTRHAF